MPSHGAPRTERALVCLLALIATYGFFLEYLPPFKRVHLWSDVVGYHYPLQRYAFASLKEGRIPLWDPAIYCGLSFVGNPQAAIFYPPTWLLYAAAWRLPRIPFKAIEIFAFAHLWIAFVLCYLWLRSRSSRLASALGAATFAFAGQFPYQLLHLGVTCAMTWIPLGLWGIDEAVERSDWRPLWKVAAASALSFLSGYPACWIAFCGILLAYALASRAHWRAAAAVALALLASALLFLAQLLPTIEARALVELEQRYKPGLLGWKTLLLAHAIPNWFDFNPGHPTYFGPGSMYFYVGLPCLFAILWAVWRRELRPYRQPLFTIAVALLMANPPGPLVLLVERFPLLDGTMQPYQFYAGVSAMAALLTAISLDAFLRTRTRVIPSWVAPVLVAMLAADTARKLWIGHAGGHYAIGERAAVETLLGLAIFGSVLCLLRGAAGRSRALLAAALLLAAGVDYKVFGAGRWFNAAEGDEDRNHPAYGIGGVSDDAYRAMIGNRQYRVATYEDAGPPPTDYRYWGLATPSGFDPLRPLEYKQAIERWTPFQNGREFFVDVWNDQMMQRLGVRYVLVRRGFEGEPRLAASPRFRLVGSGDVFCRVYEYMQAREPFFWEHGGAAQATGWTPERRDFQVRTESGDRLVLVEQFFPGWRAMVDGRGVEIERWGGSFQAIHVPAGEHHVTFEFRPASWRIGAGVSLVSVCMLLLCLGRMPQKQLRMRPRTEQSFPDSRSPPTKEPL